MKGLFSKIRDKMKNSEDYDVPEEEGEKGYVELTEENADDSQAKITLRPFILTDFADIKTILDSLRDGYTIALVNIKPLKERDIVELKRAVNKLKKTCDAIEGDIAGFGEDWIAITPSFAEIHREAKQEVENVTPEEFREF